MTKILKRTLMSISQAALLTCLFIDLSAATAPFPEEEGAQARPLAGAKDDAYRVVTGYLAPENKILSEQEKVWIRGIYGEELSSSESMGGGVLSFMKNYVALKQDSPQQLEKLRDFDRRLSRYQVDEKRRRHLLTYATTMDLPGEFDLPCELLTGPLEGIEALGQNWALLQKTFRRMFWAADDNAAFFVNLQPEQIRAVAQHWEVLAGRLILGEDIRRVRNYLGTLTAEQLDLLAEIASSVEGMRPLVRFPYNHLCKDLVAKEIPELTRLAPHAKDLLVREGYYHQGQWIGSERNPDLPRDAQRYTDFYMQLFSLDATKDWPRVMPHLVAVEQALGLCPSERCRFVGELASLNDQTLTRLGAALPGVEAVLRTLKSQAPTDRASTAYYTWKGIFERSEKALSFGVFLTYFDPGTLAKNPRDVRKVLTLFGRASQVTPLLSVLSREQKRAFQEVNGFVSFMRTDCNALEIYEEVLKRLGTFTPQGIKDLHHVVQALPGMKEVIEQDSALEEDALEMTERAPIWEMEALSHLTPSVLRTLTQFPEPLLYFFEGQKQTETARLLNDLSSSRFEKLAKHFVVFYEVCDQVAKRREGLTRERVMTDFLLKSFPLLGLSVLDDLGHRLKKQKEVLPLSHVNDLLVQEIDCFFENAYHAQAFDQEAWQALIAGTQNENGVLVDPLVRHFFLRLWQDTGELDDMPKTRLLGAREEGLTPHQPKKTLKKRGSMEGV
ncbi:MAG: hypothetical protein ACK5TR_04660 [Alphaproteobacteria bacterium]|jgi:hypothetical protein|nr:hypothetical protein [Alphaproteobacteria bacterium]